MGLDTRALALLRRCFAIACISSMCCLLTMLRCMKWVSIHNVKQQARRLRHAEACECVRILQVRNAAVKAHRTLPKHTNMSQFIN